MRLVQLLFLIFGCFGTQWASAGEDAFLDRPQCEALLAAKAVGLEVKMLSGVVDGRNRKFVFLGELYHFTSPEQLQAAKRVRSQFPKRALEGDKSFVDFWFPNLVFAARQKMIEHNAESAERENLGTKSIIEEAYEEMEQQASQHNSQEIAAQDNLPTLVAIPLETEIFGHKPIVKEQLWALHFSIAAMLRFSLKDCGASTIAGLTLMAGCGLQMWAGSLHGLSPALIAGGGGAIMLMRSATRALIGFRQLSSERMVKNLLSGVEKLNERESILVMSAKTHSDEMTEILKNQYGFKEVPL